MLEKRNDRLLAIHCLFEAAVMPKSKKRGQAKLEELSSDHFTYRKVVSCLHM